MKNLYLLLSLFYISNSYAQNWLNCTNGFHVNEGVESGETLWLATKGGLANLNTTTKELIIYNRGNSPLPSNDVRSIAIDTENRVWASTNRGVAIFDGDDWDIYYDKTGLVRLDENQQIVIADNDSLHTWNGQGFESQELQNSWYELSDLEFNTENGDKWLSYYTFGAYSIYHYDDQGLTQYNNTNSPLPFDSPGRNPLLIDNQGRLWAGNDYSLFRYDGMEWEELSATIPNIPTGSFSALDIDDEGNVWAIVRSGTTHFLVGIFEDDNFESYALPEDIYLYSSISYLHVSSSSDLQFYVGTPFDGLWHFDLSEWSYINTSLAEHISNRTYQIYLDNDTTYILGGRNINTEPLTMSSIHDGEWTIFNDDNEPLGFISEDFRGRIVERYLDTLWVHTGDTLLAYANGNWSIPQLPDLEDDVLEINSFIYHAPNGNRWLLEKYQSYIFYENNQTWTTFEYAQHGAQSGIYEAYFTHPQTGDFWIASANGLSRFDGTNWTFINPENYGMTSHWVYDLKIDENGLIWGLTRDAIFTIENNIPVIFATEIDNVENPIFRSLAFDAEGNLWVGINDAIARFDGTDWMLFDQVNSGVPNGLIDELAFDNSGNLWIGSSDGGFAIYNENGLPDFFTEDFHTAAINLQKQKEENNILVYPNPTSRNKYLNFEIDQRLKLDTTSSISIFNTTGELLLKINNVTTHSISIPLNGIPYSGICFIKIKTANEEVVKKVVVD
ncbi:MAG: two-component regulator propeller domain-containing protein [Saprospiraceae bacterium]